MKKMVFVLCVIAALGVQAAYAKSNELNSSHMEKAGYQSSENL